MEFKYSWPLSLGSDLIIASHQKSLKKIALLKEVLKANDEKLKEYKNADITYFRKEKEMTVFEKIGELKRKGYSDQLIAKILKVPLEVVRSVKVF